jgi:hypothetical protein
LYLTAAEGTPLHWLTACHGTPVVNLAAMARDRAQGTVISASTLYGFQLAVMSRTCD